jgi:hypothetical protein
MLVESAGLFVAMINPFSLVVVSPGLVCACARLHRNLASVVAFEFPKMELAPALSSKLSGNRIIPQRFGKMSGSTVSFWQSSGLLSRKLRRS